MATVTYNWQAPSSGPPDSYNLYEGDAPGAEVLLASVAGSKTAFSQSRADGPYSAFVKAVTGGVESASSNEATGNVVTPQQALTLTATPQVVNGVPSIVLNWTL